MIETIQPLDSVSLMSILRNAFDHMRHDRHRYQTRLVMLEEINGTYNNKLFLLRLLLEHISNTFSGKKSQKKVSLKNFFFKSCQNMIPHRLGEKRFFKDYIYIKSLL